MKPSSVLQLCTPMEFFVRACHLHFHNIGSQARFTLMQCGKRRELIRFRCDPNVFFMRFGYSCNLCLYLGMGGEEESKDLQKTYWNHVTLGQISALHVVSIQVHGATNHTALNPHRSLFKNASDFQCIYVNDLSRNVISLVLWFHAFWNASEIASVWTRAYSKQRFGP